MSKYLIPILLILALALPACKKKGDAKDSAKDGKDKKTSKSETDSTPEKTLEELKKAAAAQDLEAIAKLFSGHLAEFYRNMSASQKAMNKLAAAVEEKIGEKTAQPLKQEVEQMKMFVMGNEVEIVEVKKMNDQTVGKVKLSSSKPGSKTKTEQFVMEKIDGTWKIVGKYYPPKVYKNYKGGLKAFRKNTNKFLINFTKSAKNMVAPYEELTKKVLNGDYDAKTFPKALMETKKKISEMDKK